jgi:glycosyltransferase involved in cell wall biosynthesis
LCSSTNSPGVAKKINGFVQGTNNIGIQSRYLLIDPGGLKKHFTYFFEIIGAKEDIVVTRYQGTMNIFLFIGGFILRIRNKKLFIDVPTPITNLLKEMSFKGKRNFIDYLNYLHILILGPFSFLFSTAVIQYADESKWFSIFARNKTIKMGNGIDVKSIPIRNSSPQLPCEEIILVGVGTVAIWHGYDRLIRAIKNLNDDIYFELNIIFNIIGEGPEIVNLKKLSHSLGLSNQVNFMGMLFNDELFSQYEKAHFGIGTLGWSRVGIKEASPLKIREYIATGISVISATKDPDFESNYPFYFRVSEQEETKSIEFLLKRINSIELPSPIECRLFAENNLDFNVKINQIFSDYI